MENKKTKLCLLMLVMLLGICEVSGNVVNAQDEVKPVAVSEVNQEEIKANKETFENAEESIANKDYQSAIVYLTAYINSKPKKYEAYKMRGDAFYALRQFRLAEADYKKAITLKTDDDKFVTGTKVLSAVVLGADKQSQYQNPELGNLYGRLMYAQKALNNPIYESTYEQAFKFNSHTYLPKPKKEDIAKINCPQKYGKILNPQGIDEYIMDAVSKIETGQYHEAVYKIQHVTSNYPKYYFGHYLMGVAMSGMEQYDDAVHSFETALQHNPYDFESLASLGQLFYRKAETTFSSDDASKSIEYFNKAIKYNPTCHIYHFYIGLDQMIIGDYNLAITSFENAIKLKANDYNSLYYKLVAEYIMEDYSKVIEGTTNLLYRHVSNYNSVLYLRALAYYRLGNSDAALADLDKIHVNMNDIYNDDLRPLSPKEQTLSSYLYYLKAKILQDYGLGVKADLKKAYENPIIAELDKFNGKFSDEFRLTQKQVDTEYDYIRTTFSSRNVGLEYLGSGYKFVELKPVADVESKDEEFKLSTSPEDTLSIGKSSIAQMLASQSIGVIDSQVAPIGYENVVNPVVPREPIQEDVSIELTKVVEEIKVDLAEDSAEQTTQKIAKTEQKVEQVKQQVHNDVEEVAEVPVKVAQKIEEEVENTVSEQKEQLAQNINESINEVVPEGDDAQVVAKQVKQDVAQNTDEGVNNVAEEVTQVINDLKNAAETIIQTPPVVVEKHAQVDLNEFNTVQSRKVLVLKDDDEIIEFEPISLKDKVERSAHQVITPITSTESNKITEEIIKNQQLKEDIMQQELAKVSEIADNAASTPVDVNVTQSEITTKIADVPTVVIPPVEVKLQENSIEEKQQEISQAEFEEVNEVDEPEVKLVSSNKTIDEIVAPEIVSVTNKPKEKKSWFGWFKRDKKVKSSTVQDSPSDVVDVDTLVEEAVDNKVEEPTSEFVDSSTQAVVEEPTEEQVKEADEQVSECFEKPLIRIEKAEIIEEEPEIVVSEEKKKFVWWWNRNKSKVRNDEILPEDKAKTKKFNWKKFFTPEPKSKIEKVSDDKTVEEMTQEIIENIENNNIE